MSNLLETPTLVLNRSWVPTHTLPARLAIGLVARGAARIIDPETYEAHDLHSWHDLSELKTKNRKQSIRSESLCLAPLEIVVLSGYSGVGDRRVSFSRLNLYRRDKNTCQYCGIQPGTRELTIDHVMPRSRGGELSWENCVLACVKCNKRKANRTPEEASMKLKVKPARPRWSQIHRLPLRPIWSSWEKFVSDAYWQSELLD